MKKIFAFILALCLVFCMAACGKTEDDSKAVSSAASEGNSQYDDLAKKAVSILETEWKNEYSEEINTPRDGHFEIKNTRVIEIKETDIEEFKDVDYVIEFVLFTDYYGSAPYYSSTGINSTVVAYSDGRMEVVSKTPFTVYMQVHYSTDYSGIIEKVTDCGSQYNCVKKLK